MRVWRLRDLAACVAVGLPLIGSCVASPCAKVAAIQYRRNSVGVLSCAKMPRLESIMNDGLTSDTDINRELRRFLAPALGDSNCASSLFEGKRFCSNIPATVMSDPFARHCGVHHARIDRPRQEFYP